MDATTLRIVLITAGILLLVGIYLWERHDARKEMNQARRQGAPDRIEPSLDESVGPTPWEEMGDIDPVDEEEELRHLDEMVRETQAKAEERIRASAGMPPEPNVARQASPSSFSNDGPRSAVEIPESFGPAEEADEAEPSIGYETLPSMILQINVASRGAPFNGADIRRVAEEVDLELGEMQIYHRYVVNAGKREILFNMASMVEPGVFPLQEIDRFSTPGLTLFAQLPAAQDGMMVFSDMLFTAERIAAELNGELQDDTHSVLNRQTVEYIRAQILEFRRQLQIARKKK